MAQTTWAAQRPQQDQYSARLPATLDGPPAPVPPSVVNRDDRGRATLRAVRVEHPMLIDGRLDEDVYRTVPGAGDFIQQLPRQGAPATEQTEVWVLFDDKNIYISARCYDSQPERGVVNELRRDHQNIVGNENVSLSEMEKRNVLPQPRVSPIVERVQEASSPT